MTKSEFALCAFHRVATSCFKFKHNMTNSLSLNKPIYKTSFLYNTLLNKKSMYNE